MDMASHKVTRCAWASFDKEPVLELIDKLEEDDDVQAVYHNLK